MFKSAIDKKAKNSLKSILLEGLKSKGIDIDELMTDNIEENLDGLLQALIDDIGYVKLVSMGLKK